MSLPVMPPTGDDPATAPPVQVWRLDRATAAPVRPPEGPPAAVLVSTPPPCGSPPVTVTPATAPPVQTWRIDPAPATPPPVTTPCRSPLATLTGPGTRPARVDPLTRQRLMPAIQQVAVTYQLEPALLHAVISAESGYNPQARSPKGARGLMQLMPATARRFGVSDPDDPTANLQGGARYLRWLLDLFTDLRLALAAYNAGEGAVQRYGNTLPPYPETRTYVRRVLEFYRVYQHQAGR